MRRARFILLAVAISGCAGLTDAPKNILGMSTRSLEQAREKSIYQTVNCSQDQAFDKVLSAAQENHYLVFSSHRDRGLVVLMNVPRQVDTTQVGVFLTAEGAGTKVEVSSRSSSAKRTAANMVFGELTEACP